MKSLGGQRGKVCLTRKLDARSELEARVVIPAERSLKVLEFFFPSGDEINTDHIKANRRRGLLRELPDISAREAAKDSALVFIDRRFGRSEIASGAGLYFNEAKHWSVPRNEIDIPGDVPG